MSIDKHRHIHIHVPLGLRPPRSLLLHNKNLPLIPLHKPTSFKYTSLCQFQSSLQLFKVPIEQYEITLFEIINAFLRFEFIFLTNNKDKTPQTINILTVLSVLSFSLQHTLSGAVCRPIFHHLRDNLTLLKCRKPD